MYIYFLSTLHRAETTGAPTTVMRRQQDGTQVPVECPPLLPDYQAFMRGVDKGDRMISLYSVGRWLKKC